MFSSFTVYKSIKELVLNDKIYTKEDFFKLLDKTCYTEWYKMDRHGEYYGDFWNYSEDSYENKNASTLTIRDNYEGLWELPYSRELIIHSIISGCNNHQESVRYSNFYCYALELQEQQLDKYMKDVINILSYNMAKDCAIYTFSFLGSHKV